MIFRQKLTYTALGGVLMLVGMLFSSISPLTAQKDSVQKEGFGGITCSSLAIVDKEGNTRVYLGSIEEHGGIVYTYGKDGKVGVA